MDGILRQSSSRYRRALLCLFYFLATCARLSCILSFRVHVKLFYRIVSYGENSDIPLVKLIYSVL